MTNEPKRDSNYTGWTLLVIAFMCVAFWFLVEQYIRFAGHTQPDVMNGYVFPHTVCFKHGPCWLVYENAMQVRISHIALAVGLWGFVFVIFPGAWMLRKGSNRKAD
jgi:hypothetical protein